MNGQLEIEGGKEPEEGVQLSAGISLFDLGNGVLLHSNGVTDSLLRKALVLPFGSQSLTEVFGGTDFLDHRWHLIMHKFVRLLENSIPDKTYYQNIFDAT